MRIGIDASRAFGDQRTGTENYSFELICYMLALDEAKRHEWVIYTRFSNFKFSILPDGRQVFNFQSIFKSKNIQIINIPNKYLWTQVGLAARTWVDKLDVLWVPAHTLPLLRRGFGGLGRPLNTVVTIHGIEYEWLPAYENWLQRWYLPLSTQYAVKSASKIIAVSKFTKSQIVERMGGEQDKVEVILEGVEPKKPITKKQDTNNFNILNKYGLKPKQYLLFVGTVQPRKNLVRLIEAFENSSLYSTSPLHPSPKIGEGNSGNELKLVIAGKLGWNYEEVVEAAKKNKNVIITGYISDEVRQVLLENALAYVQPSITEGFGLPIIEAMQAGLPVVSSNGGALSEILQVPITKKQETNGPSSNPSTSSGQVLGEGSTKKNNLAGLLFNPYDIEEMTNKINMIINDAKLREKLILLGKQRVKDFSWEKAAKETLNVLVSCNKQHAN